MSDDENDLIAQRRQHLQQLRQEGHAFSNDFRRDSLSADLVASYNDKSKEELEAEPVRVAVAGRMMSRRVMGKAAFAHVQDMSGKIQLYVRRDDLEE
ncbi:MAG: OB-fold nucleic acid binding domain-containing protein, partial [Gammaproteobacteria bacterium]